MEKYVAKAGKPGLRLTIALTYSMLLLSEVPTYMAEVRLAVEEDIPPILALYRQLVIDISSGELEHDASPQEYRRTLAKMRSLPCLELLVAEHDGEVVGTMMLLIVPNLSHRASSWALVENLVVDSRYRRRGCGKLLMDYAVDKARASGCYKIGLASDNRREEAHKFYLSLGFEASAKGFRLYF